MFRWGRIQNYITRPHRETSHVIHPCELMSKKWCDGVRNICDRIQKLAFRNQRDHNQKLMWSDSGTFARDWPGRVQKYNLPPSLPSPYCHQIHPPHKHPRTTSTMTTTKYKIYIQQQQERKCIDTLHQLAAIFSVHSTQSANQQQPVFCYQNFRLALCGFHWYNQTTPIHSLSISSR